MTTRLRIWIPRDVDRGACFFAVEVGLRIFACKYALFPRVACSTWHVLRARKKASESIFEHSSEAFLAHLDAPQRVQRHPRISAIAAGRRLSSRGARRGLHQVGPVLCFASRSRRASLPRLGSRVAAHHASVSSSGKLDDRASSARRDAVVALDRLFFGASIRTVDLHPPRVVAGLRPKQQRKRLAPLLRGARRSRARHAAPRATRSRPCVVDPRRAREIAAPRARQAHVFAVARVLPH